MRNLRALALAGLFLLAAQDVFTQSWGKTQDVNDNFYAIRQRFLDHWKDREPGPGRGLSVFRRWEWFWEKRILPDGSFPPSNHNAIEWRNYLAKHPQTENLSAANWTSMGPSLTGSGVDNLGRINSVAIDPTNNNIIWVGSPSGGLWKSPDGGATWSTNTDQLTVLGVSSILIDPTNTNIMYIGTGDGFASDTRSIGVLKSTDGGATWNTTGLTWNVSVNNIYIRYMVMHPNAPEIILAATSNGLYRTDNAGDSWSKVSNDNFYDVKFKPGDPSVVHAASDNRVYRSINGGVSWASPLTIPGSDRIAIAVTPANPELVAAVASSGNSSDFGAFKGLYSSTDGGSSYSLKSSPSSAPNLLGQAADGSSVDGQGWYDLCIAISPTNADLIFVGGVNIWRSVNGGASWTLNTYTNNSVPGVQAVHADKHTFTWDGTTLYLGSDGGIYKTTNNGLNWIGLSDGLVISQMYRLGVSQSDNKVICGLQDNGTKLRGINGSWTDNIGGDGMECFIHPTNPSIMYGEFQYGNIRRSTNGGANWTNIHNNIPGQPEGAWVTPFVMDPNSSTTIYVGYNNVYKSTNQGNSWTTISSGLSTSSFLEFIAVAPSNSSTIYAASANAVYRTTNGGTSWSNVTGNLNTGNQLTYITVDPQNANTIYATRGGYSTGIKVFKSTTGGTTWTNISGTLPNLPANCVIVQPNSNGVLYVGMDVGIYRYDPFTSAWELFNTGLPNVVVTELEIRHSTGKIRASTYGRGLWESDLAPVVAPCNIPAPLAATNVAERSATLNWDGVANAGSYTLEWRVVGSPLWVSQSGISGSSENAVYLKPCTDYEYRVQAVCSEGPSGFSTSIPFKTTGCSNYCSTYGEDLTPTPAPDEWIANVSLGTINQSSGNDWGYRDFSDQVALLLLDSSYQISLSPGFSGAAADEAWSVWIDWNKDNDFDDAGEQAVLLPASPGVASASFTVPATASKGKTRMRVSMKADTAPGPCESPYLSGETEDYSVNIQAEIPALSVAPNQLGFPAEGGTLPVALTTNCNWSVSGVPAWLTVKPLAGNPGSLNLSITASPNTSVDSLSATFTIIGCDGAILQTITVGQSGAAAFFNATPLEFTVDYPAGCVDVFLETNTAWTATTTAPWITDITPASGTGNDTLQICFSENTDSLIRTDVVFIIPASGLDTVPVQITQEQTTVSVSVGNARPGNRVLCQPNPASDETVFVIQAGRAQTVRLEIYAADGRQVQAFQFLELREGINRVPWQTGQLPRGQYTFRCLFEQEIVSGSVVLVW